MAYGWDSADRLQSLAQGSAAVVLGYDDANRRTSLTFPNGILATYSYNPRDLTGITFTKGGVTLGMLTYATDADGRRNLLDGTWARTALPSALTSATYNVNNQQITFGGQTLTYDLNGNLTNDGSNTYTWDGRDRLSATSAGSATFQYDPLGRRTRKVIGGQTTRFHYDWSNSVQELDASVAVLANLLTALGIDEYFTRADASGTRTLLGDALGSTLALTDDTGAVQTTYTYEPFGVTTATGQVSTNSYQYTGRENDSTGLHYYRARYYNPARQRFISEDPIGFAGGDPNLYAYVSNSPMNKVDPFGLASCAGPRKKNCTGVARFSAVGPGQATGSGALAGFGVPGGQRGTVAVSPAAFGLPFPEAAPGKNLTSQQLAQRVATQRQVALLAQQITISPQGLNLAGGPAPPYTVSDIGDRNIRQSTIPRFDVYGFPSLKAAQQFGVQDVRTTISMPASLSCPPGFSESP